MFTVETGYAVFPGKDLVRKLAGAGKHAHAHFASTASEKTFGPLYYLPPLQKSNLRVPDRKKTGQIKVREFVV